MKVRYVNQHVVEQLKRLRDAFAPSYSLSPKGRQELENIDVALALVNNPEPIGTIAQQGRSSSGRPLHCLVVKEDGSVDIPHGTPVYTVPVVADEDASMEEDTTALKIARRALVKAEGLLLEIAAGNTPSKFTVQSVAQACAFAASYATQSLGAQQETSADRLQDKAIGSVDYDKLVTAAFTLHGYAQGTSKCVAFKHGAEWQARQGSPKTMNPPPGFTWAPLTPTAAMAEAGCYRHCSQFVKDYQAMMAVAPKPELSSDASDKALPSDLVEALNWCITEINRDTPAVKNGLRVLARVKEELGE